MRFKPVVPKKLDQDEQFVIQVIDIDPWDTIIIQKESSYSPVGETIDVEVVPGCLEDNQNW